jgi:hypothetical protein
LDHRQIEELRAWAKGLADDHRPEVRAASKAILLLADDLLAARSQLLEEQMVNSALEERLSREESIDEALLTRLGRRLRPRRAPEHPDGPAGPTEPA